MTAVEGVLARAVVLATGCDGAKPRPQQHSLTVQLWSASEKDGGHAVAEAATGTGKSLAYLSVVMARAALWGERAVVSTESLSLQAQVVDKDAPVVAEATHDVLGVTPTVALLKGWSNYVCLRAVKATVEELLERPAGDPDSPLWGSAVGELRAAGNDHSVLAWAMETALDGDHPGDRHSFPHPIGEEQWSMVSVTPAECVGAGSCPLAQWCKPHAAKTRAANADIIVTNHALLAVQAAHQVAAVVGSATLGQVDTIVVDEAHTLPSQVRSQGAGEVSGRRVRSLVRAVERLVQDDGSSLTVQQLVDAGGQVASLVEDGLTVMGTAGEVVRVGDSTDPTQNFEGVLSSWLESAVSTVRSYTAAADEATQLKVRRFVTRVQSVKDALATSSRHTPGIARWVEQDVDGGFVLRYSPVDVAVPLNRNLWMASPPDTTTVGGVVGSGEDAHLGDGGGVTPLTVLAVSATLPATFPSESGVRGPVVRYTSPLVEALQQSALYVPPAVAKHDVYDLAVPGTVNSSRPRFDTKAHTGWVVPQLVELVEANGGRALVLAATAQAGQQYAQALDAAAGGRWNVYQQWSGRSLRLLVSQWRDDETGVLVGTKSLMTGVDAPGDTCSLVVVDRIPRSPSNPVDDARVEDMMERLGVDRWSADRLVYVTDAALLLAQAAGRLVRATTDRGMVAVLDPRLRSASGSVFRYPDATRRTYVDAVGQFGCVVTQPEDAVKFLQRLRAGGGVA